MQADHKKIHLLLNINAIGNKITNCITTTKSISAFGEKVVYFSPQLAASGHLKRRKKFSVRKNTVMSRKAPNKVNRMVETQQGLLTMPGSPFSATTPERVSTAQNLLIKALSQVLSSNAATTSGAIVSSAGKPLAKTSFAKANEHEEFVPKVPALSGMLYDLAVQFRTEICLLQMVFDSEFPQNSKAELNDQLIVAEITLGNNSPITKEAYQFMRSTILSSFEIYQKSKKATPIFYSMTHNHTYINILCEDEYAFCCLKNSIGQMETLGSVCLYPLEPNAGRLYCFSVIYSGIENDPIKFLQQVRLQWPKMRTDYWIVASSKVCTEGKHETQFLFLVDEPSALALEYQYRNRLFICLEEALFHNHGQLPNFF